MNNTPYIIRSQALIFEKFDGVVKMMLVRKSPDTDTDDKKSPWLLPGGTTNKQGENSSLRKEVYKQTRYSILRDNDSLAYQIAKDCYELGDEDGPQVRIITKVHTCRLDVPENFSFKTYHYHSNTEIAWKSSKEAIAYLQETAAIEPILAEAHLHYLQNGLEFNMWHYRSENDQISLMERKKSDELRF